jgi:catechol 2,3-dioxygenase-like lactoylglutathione lyase family enzyme
MATRVSETIYYVHDLDKAVAFYRDQLGFELLDKQDWGWALFSVDGAAKVGLLTEAVWRQSGADYDILPHPRLAMRTNDIEGEVARLKSAGVSVGEIQGDVGKMRAVTYRDLCGNEFFLWDDGSPLD